MLALPKDCPSIKDYFLTRVGRVTATDLGGKEVSGISVQPLSIKKKREFITGLLGPRMPKSSAVRISSDLL